ncbi:MAG: TonB-dependent receptor [Tannerellaceae bacterium]|jgi:hypothetical protein|nr:TonB-dependent receptor [Tannerellaceae bacterium]
MKRLLFAIGLTGMQALMIHAQTETGIRGTVKDAVTGEAIEMATVKLLKGESERLVNYTISDANGEFMIRQAAADSLTLSVYLLGYEEMRVPVQPGVVHSFALKQKTFDLREVEVRPGRVWGRQDTINYDVSQFLSAGDNTVKDVIRKLPGVDVDDLGRISYNGKQISNLYVEGMDITDGKYGQMTNNLDAKAVDKVQVLENHQPIRILKNKVKTEDIAMNLKLKEDFKGKWMATVKGGLGASAEELLWDANLSALQLGRNRQTTYGLKSNNRGVDITEEMTDLAALASLRIAEPAPVSFLSLPSLEAPLKKEKMLFNEMHTLSANRLYRLNETAQLRLNAGYVYDRREQDRGNETTWYQANDTVRISEQSHTALRTGRGELKAALEKNADSHFLDNRISLSGEWGAANSRFTGNRAVDQQIRQTDLLTKNEFRTNWNRGAVTYEASSFMRYNHLPGELTINGTKERLPLNRFYTDNSFSALLKKGVLTQRYTAGIKGELSNIYNGYNPYMAANLQATIGKWQWFLNIPAGWIAYPGAGFSRPAVNPSVSANYKYNYAWQFRLNASYRESYGDITNLYAAPYRTNYLITVQNNGFLPVRCVQSYGAYGEYKNTIREFFATLSAYYTHNASNIIYEQMVEPEEVTISAHKAPNTDESWSLQGTLSKSFYDRNMKASLNYQFVSRKAEMISQGKRLPYRSEYMLYEPKISWSPNRRWETIYQGNFRYGGNIVGENKLSPLWNIVQKLSVSYNLFPVELNLSADHYYNDISRDKSLNAFFFDAMLRWKTGTWQFECALSNLFDKRQYSYTQYNSLQSHTSWINIRGRELLLSAQYKF